MGERQFGPYRLVEEIAVGGMAEIYLAKTSGVAGFEKYVALKMIHPNFSSDEQFVQMLIDEAKITVQLQHVNIAQTFDLGRVGDRFYLTMEYVDGSDLYSILRKGSEQDRSMPIDVAAFVGREVTSGLDYAHRKRDVSGRPLGIVHRDVSPQNVLISHAGEVKLVDFGIAKASHRVRQTAAGVIKGKYYYMSPEQALAERVDHRSDIFSAGILLYEMLTGEMLYLEEDMHKLLDRVRKADIPPPTTVREDIPPELERIVMRALAKRPDDRFQSAGSLSTELERFLYSYSPVFTATKAAGYMREVSGGHAGASAPAASPPAADPPKAASRVTQNLADEHLVRERSEFYDENSVIFRVKDLAPAPPRYTDDLSTSPAGGPGRRMPNAHTQQIPARPLVDDEEEHTVISGPPSFDPGPGTGGAPEAGDDGDDEGDDDEATRVELGDAGPRDLALGAQPAGQASNPRPAVSELAPARPSRRTPPGGVPAPGRPPSADGLPLAPPAQTGQTRAAPARSPGPQAPGESPAPGAPHPGHAGAPHPGHPSASPFHAATPGAPAGHAAPGASPQGQVPGHGGAPQPGASPVHAGMPGAPAGHAAPGASPQGQVPGHAPAPDYPRALQYTPTPSPGPTPAPTLGRWRRSRWMVGGMVAAALAAIGAAVGVIVLRDEPAAPAARTLQIVSIPEGAEVAVNGEPLAEPTPTAFTGAEPGQSYTIEIEHPHHEPWSKTMQVPEKGSPSQQVVADLGPARVALTIDTQPPGAEVFLEDRPAGHTPILLEDLEPQAARKLRIELDGYEPIERELDWSGDAAKELSLTLER